MRPIYKRYNANKLTAADFARLIPDRLYKYRVINEFFYNSLATNSLWFARPTDFNDPFDCRLSITIGKTKTDILENLKAYEGLIKMKGKRLQAILDSMMDNPVFYNDFMSKMHQLYITERLGVCCLAEDADNMLMWAHYAASHTGACLEFEIERDGFFYNNVLPVQYKTKYPRFDLSKYKGLPRNLYTMHQQAVCTKSVLWEYESEWRVIVDKGFGAYPFEKKHLRKIIFGALATDATIQKVQEALQTYGYTHTLLCKAQPLGKSFGISIKPL